MKESTWSNFVVKRLSEVMMPPFGPRLYLSSNQNQCGYDRQLPRRTDCFMTSL
jgi:hypothetical protein